MGKLDYKHAYFVNNTIFNHILSVENGVYYISNMGTGLAMPSYN